MLNLKLRLLSPAFLRLRVMRQASLELEIREDVLIVGVNNPLLRNYPSVSFAQLFESLAVSVE